MHDDEEIRFWPIDVGREFHRSADWLVKLERAGIVPRARRDISGRRYYTPADVERIREILERRRALLFGGGDAA